ncbi:MAG: hypothetical protein NTV34_13465, partial [Proteobacteria bacterium]|nr:hypothetical protein [Pseudomonadota bacterium]
IKTGAFYTCAMFQNKTSQRSVQCWGADLGVINGIPKFNAPILSIASLPSDMCAYLANKTIQCWGEHGNNSSDATSAEWMESATPTCSYDTGSKLNCAPSLEMNLQNSKPLQTSSWIVKPMQIAFAKSCKSAEDVVSCNTFNFAAKGKVLSLAISKSKVCALHSDGVTCYNEKTKSIAELALPGQFISSQLILKEP